MCSIRQRVVLLRLLIIALAAAVPARAQDTGTISGSVVDQSGQVLPGASVSLIDEATSIARTIVSNERGDFAFRAVQPGTYTVTVELSGFSLPARRVRPA